MNTVQVNIEKLENDLKWVQDRLSIYDNIVSTKPNAAEIFFEIGLALQQSGQAEASITYYQKAYSLSNQYAEAYVNCGVAFEALKNFDQAMQHYDAAIRVSPELAVAYNNRGFIKHQLKDYAGAINDLQHALQLKPDYVDAHWNLANVYIDQEQYELAIASFKVAQDINPDYVAAYVNCGVAYEALEDFDAALACYQKALSLDDTIAVTYNNIGFVQQVLGQYPEAIESYQKAIELQPDYPNALCNFGNLYMEQRQFDKSLAYYEKSIELRPDYAGAYWNKALLKLVLGQLSEGWELFEWRWKDQLAHRVRNYPQPRWAGESLDGKKLLIHAEQGMGDMIQFSRYILKLQIPAENIILEVPAVLIPLLETLKPGITLIALGQPLPEFDFYSPIMSLPGVFGTTLETIPGETPYLSVTPEQKRRWQRRLGKKTGFRVGLVWSGATGHKKDRNRSIPLNLFESILSLPLEFHALQKEVRPSDLEYASQFGNLHLHHEKLLDFSDTAAIASLMDVIISVDTATVHLAGAMGKPIWAMLSYSPDYRWLLDRADSPWYPSAVLFRQPKMFDWPSVIAEVTDKLKALAKLA